MAEGTCTVDGCKRTQWARELCGMHYQRWQRVGTTHLLSKPTVEERFWAKVDKNGPVPAHRPTLGQCWIWTGFVSPSGYGFWGYGARGQQIKITAYRFAYEQADGSVPDGLHIDHLCRNRTCVRRSHLEAVTQAENNRRSAAVRLKVTHCPRGHEYTPENTIRQPSGVRICRTCFNAKRRAKRLLSNGPPLRGPGATPTHCPAGHEYAGDNLYLHPRGSRECRTCRSENFRAWNEKRKADRPEREPKSHCPRGHEYAGDNLYVSPSGGRNCRACVRAQVRAYRERKKAEVSR